MFDKPLLIDGTETNSCLTPIFSTSIASFSYNHEMKHVGHWYNHCMTVVVTLHRCEWHAVIKYCTISGLFFCTESISISILSDLISLYLVTGTPTVFMVILEERLSIVN